MKLFSIKQGSLLKSITTKSGNRPSDIAVTNSGNLVYTDYSLGTVNIVKDKNIVEMIRLQNWKPQGVCITSSGGFLVTMENESSKQSRVVRYYGSVQKQIIYGTVAVVVVNQAGKFRFRYTGVNHALNAIALSPRGITTDSQSNILIADVYNCCIHIIDQDGQFLRYIYCKLSQPWGQ
ncbi:tripartite motif-containing protein 2-like [Saccostrea cucullata]|uniref:tripartite motif-containing protein 2-like n=1 Tax=Saccostrea cuccullata TaxID=36930 RepID=UPI002ED26BDC